jgi:hypothetical protein
VKGKGSTEADIATDKCACLIILVKLSVRRNCLHELLQGEMLACSWPNNVLVPHAADDITSKPRVRGNAADVTAKDSIVLVVVMKLSRCFPPDVFRVMGMVTRDTT